MVKIKETKIVKYSLEGESLEADIILREENVWADQKTIAEIFQTERSVITKHISNIFLEKELEENNNVHFLHIANSKKPKKIYSLDVIISVGYRVNSKKATQFRIWATQKLTQYIKDGYVLDEERLRNDPQKLKALAAKIRELRANEKNVYASVRECFKLSASDYTPNSQEVRLFYAFLQDKFHHAVTRMTASKLILDRADHTCMNMGLQTIKGILPTKKETKIGKNYLNADEIYKLHLLSEQFLIFAETTALREKQITMQQLREKLDELLRFNGYEVFHTYEDSLKEIAIEHAENEYAMFLEIKRLEHLGIEVDLELFYMGEYDEYKEQTCQITRQQLTKALAM